MSAPTDPAPETGFDVSRAVRGILDIFVSRLEADRRDYDRSRGKLVPRIRRACRTVHVLDATRLQVCPTFSLLAIPGATPEDEKDSDEDWVVKIEATYVVEYHVEGLERFSEAALIEFAQLNGVFNVWPYWRELVQSTLGRMNLPGLLVPIFKANEETQKVTGRHARLAAQAAPPALPGGAAPTSTTPSGAHKPAVKRPPST